LKSRSNAALLGRQVDGKCPAFGSVPSSTAVGVESMSLSPDDPFPAADLPGSPGPSPRLNGITPAQVASFMLDVGGRLVGLDARRDAGHPLVVYTFDVAGKRQSFEVAVRDGAVESIAQLFPEAAHPEAALHERLGITFQPPGAA
jgi:hypothetical protein